MNSVNAKPHPAMSVLIYALALLSAAAGIPKILQMPQELGFLSGIGFSPIAVSILGIVQLTGGILLLPVKFRLYGAGLAALAFLLSSIAIFVGGNATFGLVSLLPVLASCIVIYSLIAGKRKAP